LASHGYTEFGIEGIKDLRGSPIVIDSDSKVIDLNLTHIFKDVQQLCSRSDFPLSAYVLLVQALRNELNVGLNKNGGEFSKVLGANAAKEVADMIRERFNMNGLDPSGRTGGLIDRHHYWNYLVDPFNHELRSTFLAQPSAMATLIKEMIEHYVPLDDDGLSKK
jgi:hypothetical protein